MFGLFKKKKAEPTPGIRDTLFGDLPIEIWAREPNPEEPWSSFFRARQALEAGNKPAAIEILTDITKREGLEPRHYLQAWHFLRPLRIQPPPDKAKIVYGVVVEVAMDKGFDLLAAYPDYSARYYNFSGAGVVWEHPDTSLNAQIDALLQAGRVIAAQIGPWDKDRPPAVTRGMLRINMLTPSGLHFGQGPFEMLQSDPMAAPLINSATVLMQALIKKSGQS